MGGDLFGSWHHSRGACRLVAAVLTLGVLCPASAADETLRFGNPSWSPDGRHLALSDDNANGVYLYDTQTETCLQVTDAPSSGYAYNWSADGKRLGFKLLIPFPGSVFPLQMPAVFDLQRQAIIPLCNPVARAGVPSFSKTGLTAFTVDRELRICDHAGNIVQTVPLDHYVNLAPISPDGSKVLYTTEHEQIAVLDLSTGQTRRLTSDDTACYAPVWSPDSNLAVVSTLAGRLKSVDAKTGQTHDLDQGTAPCWAPDGKTVLYTRTDRIDAVRVVESDIYHIHWDGSGRNRLTTEPGQLEAAGSISPDGHSLAFISMNNRGLYRGSLTRNSASGDTTGRTRYFLGPANRLAAKTVSPATLQDRPSLSLLQGASEQPPPVTAATTVSLLRPVPYVHQVYDTPDAFNGHWACGATSAIMAINYYDILPYWDVTCSWPYSHVSHYGRYVSEIYTFNGVTYDIRAKDASGRWAYGGYAYIVRDNWADTKGYMRDYIINHGLASSVDWSPSWTKLQTEVNNDDPFVVLNMLTTAGHYIVAIGYYTTQHTAIFNDPYGNKNTPGYPSYDGAGALYDWPGYNNGYQNLNTVHCFIYCRGGLPPLVTQQPVDQNIEWRASASFSVAAVGEGTLSYQWQKDAANLDNGEHYSGVNSSIVSILLATDQEAGSYRCVVTNSYGGTTSASATLTVAPRPGPPGDMDIDGDVDQKDFGLFQACLSGTTVPQDDPACADARLDGDSDVDYSDTAIFIGCVSGPQVPADWNCDTP